MELSNTDDVVYLCTMPRRSTSSNQTGHRAEARSPPASQASTQRTNSQDHPARKARKARKVSTRQTKATPTEITMKFLRIGVVLDLNDPTPPHVFGFTDERGRFCRVVEDSYMPIAHSKVKYYPRFKAQTVKEAQRLVQKELSNRMKSNSDRGEI